MTIRKIQAVHEGLPALRRRRSAISHQAASGQKKVFAGLQAGHQLLLPAVQVAFPFPMADAPLMLGHGSHASHREHEPQEDRNQRPAGGR